MSNPDLSADLVRQVTEHLHQIRELVQALRSHVQDLEIALTETQVAQGTLELLHEFTEAGRRLLGHEDALRASLRLSAFRQVDYISLGQQLNALRNANDQYDDTFRRLWRSALPIQVQAALQRQDTTIEMAWEKRWFTAGSRAYQIFQDPAVYSPERLPDRLPERLKEHDVAEALLTLRYADVSLNDVSNILGLSVPPVLSSQNTFETAITVELLRSYLPCDSGIVEFENVKQPSRDALPKTRSQRYTRLLQISCGLTKTILLLRVITDDDDFTEEDSFSYLGSIKKPEYFVFYKIGADEFRFAPYSEKPESIRHLFDSGRHEFPGFPADSLS